MSVPIMPLIISEIQLKKQWNVESLDKLANLALMYKFNVYELDLTCKYRLLII